MLVPVAALLLQRLWHDRSTFNAAMAKVEEGLSHTQVKAILGPPDDIWTPADSSLYAGAKSNVWCYGSDRHLGFPTLGRVDFREGRVWASTARPWQDAIPNLPPETELRPLLRALHPEPKRRLSTHDDPDALYFIRTSNILRPLGKAKAIAVLQQYARLVPDIGGTGLLWLSHLLFQSKRPSPTPWIGVMRPTRPERVETWPTYPILIEGDIPFNFYAGALIRGAPETILGYIARAGDDWTIRQKPLRPNDDPFKALQNASERYRGFYGDPDPRIGAEFTGASQLRDVLRLVRNAYRAPELDDEELNVSMEDFDRHHEEYLAAGGHWSETLQSYVGRSGIPIPDHAAHRLHPD